MSCPVHRAKRVKTCSRCINEALRTIGYAIEDGRADSGGHSEDGEVEFSGKTYRTDKARELFELADLLDGMDYDPY